MSSDSEKLFDAVSANASAEEVEELKKLRSGTHEGIAVPDELMGAEGGPANEENLYALIKDLSIPGKIKLAMFGNKTARGMLIKDTNKQVALFVLENSRITEGEIAEFARNKNLDELVFRAIARNGDWMKNYSVKSGMVANPKVPVDIALKLVKFIQPRELRQLSKSKNIPQVIATQCRKLIEKRKKSKS